MKSYSQNKNTMLEQMVRINHAGEYAAKRIYEGQIKYIKDQKTKKLIKEMAKGEEEHLEYFDNHIKKNSYRPTILQPLVGGVSYAVGALTALCGKEVAMLCTHAVEDVISQHYKEQEKLLADSDKDLKKNITKFRKDEEEHHHTAEKYDLDTVPARRFIEKAIKCGCHLGIKLTKHL